MIKYDDVPLDDIHVPRYAGAPSATSAPSPWTSTPKACGTRSCSTGPLS